MSKPRTHMTWRTFKRAGYASSLQTLQPRRDIEADVTRLHWVTVARGDTKDLRKIAEALNRARFTLFDIRPASSRKRRC